MNKLLSLGLGLAVGALVCAAAVVLFAPQSGPDLRENLRTSYQEALEDARRASLERRAELEAALAGLPKRPPRSR